MDPSSSTPPKPDGSTDTGSDVESWTFLDEPAQLHEATIIEHQVHPILVSHSQAEVLRAVAEAANDDSWDDYSETGSEAETEADEVDNHGEDIMATSSVEDFSDNDLECDKTITGNVDETEQTMSPKTNPDTTTETPKPRPVHKITMISQIKHLAHEYLCPCAVVHQPSLTINKPKSTRYFRSIFCLVPKFSFVVSLFFMVWFLDYVCQMKEGELQAYRVQAREWQHLAITTSAKLDRLQEQVDRLQTLVDANGDKFKEKMDINQFVQTYNANVDNQNDDTEELIEKRFEQNPYKSSQEPSSYLHLDSYSEYFEATSELGKNVRRNQQENQRRLYAAKSKSRHPEEKNKHDERTKVYKYNTRH